MRLQGHSSVARTWSRIEGEVAPSVLKSSSTWGRAFSAFSSPRFLRGPG